jgi:TetR/AcrR family transcriptional regulator, transcriptional repressor for nem operon
MLASKRLREEGLAGIGIAELMKEAGLTVGRLLQALQVA